MPDYPPETDMDAMVERIKCTISELGVCQLRRDELPLIWRPDGKLPDEKKRAAIQHFAQQHGLCVVVDYDLAYVIFR